MRKRDRHGAGGRDYLLASATSLAGRDDKPHGEQFLSLVQDGGTAPPLDPDEGEGPFGSALGTEIIARRPLATWEKEAIDIIGAAYDVAVRDGNHRAAREVFALGLPLFARWAGYLEYVTDEGIAEP